MTNIDFLTRAVTRVLVVIVAIAIDHDLCGQERISVPATLKMHAELVTKSVYPGEMPRVRITVHAPSNRSVEVVRSISAWSIGALRVSLIGEDGVRVPGGLSTDGTSPPRSSDFVRIEPGKQYVIEEPILTRVPAPGKFVVRIDFTASPGGTELLEADLALTCREIRAGMVSRRYLIQEANEQEQLELLNVTDNGVCELVFRRTRSKDSVVVARLFEIDPNANVVAVFRPRLAKEAESDQVWFCWKKSRELWLGKLNTLSGRVVMTKPAFGNDER